MLDVWCKPEEIGHLEVAIWRIAKKWCQLWWIKSTILAWYLNSIRFKNTNLFSTLNCRRSHFDCNGIYWFSVPSSCFWYWDYLKKLRDASRSDNICKRSLDWKHLAACSLWEVQKEHDWIKVLAILRVDLEIPLVVRFGRLFFCIGVLPLCQLVFQISDRALQGILSEMAVPFRHV